MTDSGLTAGAANRKGRSWLVLAAEAIVVTIWLVTIVSVLAGQWPEPTRWYVLLSATGAAASRRLAPDFPRASVSMLLLAAALSVAGILVSR
jgi:hypothetical protein